MAESNIRIKRRGYAVIFRSAAQDKRLSLKARGLFLFMMSLPRDFVLSQKRLAALTGVGRDQIRAALKELETVGYLVAEQSHDASGKFSRTDYVLQEEAPGTPPPLSENPATVSPENAAVAGKTDDGKPGAGKPDPINNTNHTNTPLTPQGEKACVSANANPDAADAASDSDAANADAAPRAVTSNCRRPRSSPKWKPERFAGFWAFYSRHGRREAFGDAVKAWDKLKPDDDTINLMAAALRNQVNGEMWRRGIGIPYAATWINKRKWETPSDNNDVPAPDEQEVTGWL